MPASRFAEALRLIRELHDLDPNNKRLPDVIRQVESADRAQTLCDKYAGTPPSTLSPAVALDLAEAQLAVFRREANATLRSVFDRRSSLSHPELIRLGSLCATARLYREAAAVFQSLPAGLLLASPDLFQTAITSLINGGAADYADSLLATHLRTNGQDWRGWLELAMVRSIKQNPKEAAIALLQASRIVARCPREEQEAFQQMVESNPVLSDLARSLREPQPAAPKAP